MLRTSRTLYGLRLLNGSVTLSHSFIPIFIHSFIHSPFIPSLGWFGICWNLPVSTFQVLGCRQAPCVRLPSPLHCKTIKFWVLIGSNPGYRVKVKLFPLSSRRSFTHGTWKHVMLSLVCKPIHPVWRVGGERGGAWTGHSLDSHDFVSD